jgi:hypothetical protein
VGVQSGGRSGSVNGSSTCPSAPIAAPTRQVRFVFPPWPSWGRYCREHLVPGRRAQGRERSRCCPRYCRGGAP